MNISVRVKPTHDEEGVEIYEAYAYTEGFGVKATAMTQGGALRKLISKLKLMNRFSRIARSILETRIGFHQCNINFKIEQEPKHDN